MDPTSPFAAFVKRMLGPAADELAGMWQDKVRLARYERQLKVVEKAERMVKEAGFSPLSVSIKLLLPLVEGVSFEGDEDREAMWAALLASAASSDQTPAAETPSLENALSEEKKSLSDTPSLLVDCVAFSPAFFRVLQEDSERLRDLTPEQFEHFVAERLDRMGYRVRLTGSTNRKHGGIDLIAVPKAADSGSVIIAVQIKHHRKDGKTGREAVDRLLAWKDSVFGVGLLVTNTEFTRDAIWAAQRESNRHFVRLRDSNDMKRWLDGRFGDQDDWREMPDSIELAPGIVVEIPKPVSGKEPDMSHRPPKPKS